MNPRIHDQCHCGTQLCKHKYVGMACANEDDLFLIWSVNFDSKAVVVAKGASM